MKNNEPLSNKAYFHPSARRNLTSPQQRMRDVMEHRLPEQSYSLRTHMHGQQFQTLQTNLRNTLTLKIKGEYEQTLNEFERDNNNLREENSSLRKRLNEYEQRITGLHTQLEVKKAIRQGRRANLKMLKTGSGQPINEEFEKAAEIYESEINRWKNLYDEQLKNNQSLKVQLSKVDTHLDSLVADYLTEAQM